MPINLDDYDDEIAQLERGETTHVDHAGCKAGEDHKRRLYLTRPAASAGIVLAFCHNCQESGIKRDQVGHYRDFNKRISGTIEEVEQPFEVPVGMEPDPALWPDDATEWRVRKALSKEMCMLACIQYDPSSHRIYLPQYTEVGVLGHPNVNAELTGFQLRRLSTRGPKYYTAAKDQDTKPSTKIWSGNHAAICVLVEDLASGLVLMEACQHLPVQVLVNYGVKVTPEVLATCRDADRSLVWLDNDGSQIVRQARKISKTWHLLTGRPVHIEAVMTDPKHYHADELREAVTEWMTC